MRSLFLALPLFLVSVLPVQATPPLVTEDAGTAEKGVIELESNWVYQREKHADNINGFHVQTNVGIGWQTQLGISYDALKFDDEWMREYTLSGKTAIKPLTNEEFGVTIAYSLGRTKIPGGSFRTDMSSVSGVVTVPVDAWLFHGNLGWEHSRLESRSSTVWGVAVERLNAIGPIDLMMETFGDDREPAVVNFGARWNIVPEHFFIDASYGVQLSGSKPQTFTLGMKLAF